MKMIKHVQLYSFSQTTIMINTLLVLFVNQKKINCFKLVYICHRFNKLKCGGYLVLLTLN